MVKGRRGHRFREWLFLSAAQAQGSSAAGWEQGWPPVLMGPTSDQGMDALKQESSEQSPSEVPSFCSEGPILVPGSGQGT